MRRFHALIALFVLALAWSASPAWGYRDIIYNFSVTGPDRLGSANPKKPANWLVVKDAEVPGFFRFGWMAASAVKTKSGASVLVFVQVLDKDYTAQDLLSKNLEEMNLHKSYYKIVHSATFQAGSRSGFTLDVVAPGTGFSILPAASSESLTIPTKDGSRTIKNPKITDANIPTHQRWYAVVRGNQIIGVLSTCAVANYKQYAPLWDKVEKSLNVGDNKDAK